MSTFAEHAFLACSAQAKQLNRRLTKSEWLAAIQQAYDSYKPASAPRTSTRRSPAAIDNEWLATLEANPAYQGIDIKRELGKAQAWASVKGVGISRQRFINWLNKATNDRPIQFNGTGATSFAPKPVPPPQEPRGWREWVRENSIDGSMADKPWMALEESHRTYIISQLNKPRESAKVELMSEQKENGISLINTLLQKV